MKAKPSSEVPAVPGVFDNALATSVRESAQQIWLAGMGAFAKAQAEGGKVFDALVQEGASLQRKTQLAAEERFNVAADRITTLTSEATGKAGAPWDKLESIFENRTAKAMGKLGVPTAADMAALTRRLDDLAALIEKLSKPPAAKPGSPARKAKAKAAVAAPARKPATKAVRKAVRTGSALPDAP